MSTAEDYRDALMGAAAELMEAVRELHKENFGENIEKIADQVWAQMDDEAREQFKRDDPEGYRKYMNRKNERKVKYG